MKLAMEFAISSDPEAESILDQGLYAIRYEYNGPIDEKNRQFCAEVLGLNLIYRKEDINQMSFSSDNPDFGTYSIFDYKGSYGCRHNWERLTFKKVDLDTYEPVPNSDLPPSYETNDELAQTPTVDMAEEFLNAIVMLANLAL